MNVWCAKIEIMTLFRVWASRVIARYRISHLSGWNHQFDQIMCVCLLYMDILQRLRVQVCDRNVNLPCGDVRAAVIVDFWDARAVIDSTRRSVRIGTFLEYANYVRIEIYHEGYIVWLYLQFQCCSCSNKRMLSKNWNRDSVSVHALSHWIAKFEFLDGMSEIMILMSSYVGLFCTWSYCSICITFI